MTYSVLIVEDDLSTRLKMEEVLTRHFGDKIHIDSAESGESALEYVKSGTKSGIYDIVLLDIVLPDIDGYQIAEEFRRRDQAFIMISSRDLPSDVIKGFEVGAEEYLRKPVDPRELAVRVEHVLKRVKPGKRGALGTYQCGDLLLDFEGRRVSRAGRPVELTPIELNILLLLAENGGRYVHTDTIIEHIWQDDPPSDGPKTVRVHIRRLRAKIEPDPSTPRYLLNRWGAGYMLESSLPF